MNENNIQYDLFISYSTNPDYGLANNLESFLEGIHLLPTPDNLGIRQLRVCLDGSDFSQYSDSSNNSIDEIILEKLKASKELLILLSKNSTNSRWVQKEVKWFIENKGLNYIRIAMTDPIVTEKYLSNEIGEWLSDKIWYDFRLYKKKFSKNSEFRDFETEKLRLASDILQIDPNELQPLWFRNKIRAIRKFYLTIISSLTTIFITILSTFIFLDNQNVKATIESLVRSGNDLEVIQGIDYLSNGYLPRELDRLWRFNHKLNSEEVWNLLKDRENNSVKAESFLKSWHQYINNKKIPSSKEKLANLILYILPSIDEKNSFGTLAASLDLAYWDEPNNKKYLFTRKELRNSLISFIGIDENTVINSKSSMKWVNIKGGEFIMGCIEELEGKAEEINELPIHNVRVRDFQIQRHELTQKQYQLFNKSYLKKSEHPIANISWFEAYTVALFYDARLPTEAEWEYAARGNSKIRYRFFNGNNEEELDELGWFRSNSNGSSQRVMLKNSNSFGLYDMHGNVYEWCLDYFQNYQDNNVENPFGSFSGKTKVQRGGAFKSDAKFCTSSNRGKLEPHRELPDVGFRVVKINSSKK